MPRFSANLSILFTELPFLDRFAAAKRAGFDAVECWFPYEHGVAAVARLLRELQLTMVGINTAPGGGGDWGLAAVPGREADFDATLDEALDAARTFGGCAVHVLGGMADGSARSPAWQAYLANLERAVRRAGGVQLLIEPLNSRDRPGYILHSVDRAAEVVARPALAGLKLMFDCYHVQMEDGDVLGRLRRHYAKVGHIQFANTPGRTEPGIGEIDYRAVFAEVDRLGWPGHVGAEYQPGADTTASLGWLGWTG